MLLDTKSGEKQLIFSKTLSAIISMTSWSVWTSFLNKESTTASMEMLVKSIMIVEELNGGIELKNRNEE